MTTDLHAARREYQGGELPPRIEDPWAFLAGWFGEALAADIEASAMVLSTVDADGQPSSRVVLAKAFGRDLGPGGGVDFYSDLDSRKGLAMQANPKVSLLFYWPALNRQVHIEGQVQQKPVAEAEEYFHQRPLASQVAAAVSKQSEPRESRASLVHEFEQAAERFGEGPVPRPQGWLGWRVRPDRFQFWQGLPSRLHDRVECRRDGEGWTSGRLDP
ncbi:pyridoxamine 5'-phosphate oxidase [Aestuariimicrobium sp. p3-SID1156]|uniref:pyridoxamine 5'-phosphate oxidase n=1 Tax=Aestuariimicrobium sp. p3-SID1156 TaxID=2916038 RepID=UPI00223B2F98|nr:pyridoxamine 5'-phosphate oxidase [Aestuariimicrobium sp. p3-SID1156]MCT1458451.1 pyridoxamine 5'-phosphate oxidase [Aestuariimicrobium sp. p3-SID1156]